MTSPYDSAVAHDGPPVMQFIIEAVYWITTTADRRRGAARDWYFIDPEDEQA
jgi:hypothetical protein